MPTIAPRVRSGTNSDVADGNVSVPRPALLAIVEDPLGHA